MDAIVKLSREAAQGGTRTSVFEETRDDFPTPPWATRAGLRYAFPDLGPGATVLEPACGAGHMVRPLREAGLRVLAYDRFRYDRGHRLRDYLDPGAEYEPHDYVITNPPFTLAAQFAERALGEARLGVGLLCRTLWLVGKKRHEELFSRTPPTLVVVFSRGMPATGGRVIRTGGGPMSHSWFWWDLSSRARRPQVAWIPPGAQRELERGEDYLRP